MVYAFPTRYCVHLMPASEDGTLRDAIHIRPAHIGDIAFLEACARETYGGYVEAIGRQPAPMVFDFRSRLGEMPIEVMETDATSVGYLVWYLNEDHLFLESIAISTRYQGHGFARLAIVHLEKQAMAASRRAIELYTNEKMADNLTLYPHLGFTEIARRHEHGFKRVYFRKTLP